MIKDLTFKEVTKFIKKDDASLVESVDRFLGAIIVISPLIFGPQVLPVWGVLGIKGELTKLGKRLIEKVNSKQETDYLSRMERLQIAYGLICFTSFFEALDRALPAELRKEIDLQPKEKSTIATRAVRKTKRSKNVDTGNPEVPQESLLDIVVPFPHPVSDYEDLASRLDQLYTHMAKNLAELFLKLAVSDDQDEKTSAQLRSVIQELPGQALACFESQYLELARLYPDFCVWSRLHEHKTTQGKLKNISEYLKQHASLLRENDKKIDVGFEKLQKTITAMHEHFNEVEAKHIVDGLKRSYRARIGEPIIEDKYEPREGKPSLNFPKIAEAFVPQSYRVLRYDTKNIHLEREETWSRLPPRNDLGAFLISYLSSPYSIETPLLILGHPGSGKSLLTKILCAQLMSQAFTPVRIPLREVNADSPIESQIEDQIHRVTGNRITSWANFSSQFCERPLVIILDGYDELLQASGKVFAGYLKSVQQFQQRESEQGRPVRLIVTSRITLIDKATVPEGSTIVMTSEVQDFKYMSVC